MAQLFPKWTNALPILLLFGMVSGAVVTVGLIWYYFSPKYYEVGYRPEQPVAYSHRLHVGELGMDCRYCHVSVEISQEANIPPTQTCMNCHSIVRKDSAKLQLVRDSFANDTPIEWVRVHKLPDFAYFDHSVHIRAGVGCASCHGNIAQMEVVETVSPLSMRWCLDCHRDPAPYLRPHDQITNTNWQPPPNQRELGQQIIDEKQLNPPEACSACHR